MTTVHSHLKPSSMAQLVYSSQREDTPLCHLYRSLQFDPKRNDWVYARRSQIFYPRFPERKEFIREMRVVPRECGSMESIRRPFCTALNFSVFEADLPAPQEKRNPCLERMLARVKENLEPTPVSL